VYKYNYYSTNALPAPPSGRVRRGPGSSQDVGGSSETSVLIKPTPLHLASGQTTSFPLSGVHNARLEGVACFGPNPRSMRRWGKPLPGSKNRKLRQKLWESAEKWMIDEGESRLYIQIMW